MQNTLVAPVGVLGFGVEGQSTFNYLVRNGIKDIVIMDKNPVKLPEVPAGINVKVSSGENYMDGLKDCVTVVRSAGDESRAVQVPDERRTNDQPDPAVFRTN